MPRQERHCEELPLTSFDWTQPPDFEGLVDQEWLVTNGLGSYASGSVAFSNTRRYHGLFIPSLPAPHGRTVVLPRMAEQLLPEGSEATFRLDCEERTDGSLEADGLQCLKSFRLRGLVPEWEYQLGPVRLRRRIVLVHGENTVFVTYDHLSGPPTKLRLRPFVAFRPHDRQLLPDRGWWPTVRIRGDRLDMVLADDVAPLRFRLYSSCRAPFVSLSESSSALCYRVERARGLDFHDVQASPGYFECSLSQGESLSVGATVAAWEVLDRDPATVFSFEEEREHRLLELAPEVARKGTAARLVLAADQFVIDPVTRPRDEAWARATGQEVRSVIAGYHWFTDWGRDTMISLEGLTLSTGRHREAASILRTFAHYIRDGLLPNLFPEGGHDGLYHTADATLWYFHAIDRYLEATGDEPLLKQLFPKLERVIEHHLKGTRFGIGVDPQDGLIRQGAEGYALTWMDAKVDGWVVTPRRGKAVEINALWYNALELMAEWAPRMGADAGFYKSHAERTQTAFNQRFWNEANGCLKDVVDGEGGDDEAVRPNQIFSMSLKYPVLERTHWAAVLGRVQEDLLTPVGLRSLSPRHPDYKAKYDGDLRSRDAAYHQGTVWTWLLGHFIDAHLKLHPDIKKAHELLRGLERHLTDAGVGQISEVFDASEPYNPRGCVAQAWSVAEALRLWLKTVP